MTVNAKEQRSPLPTDAGFPTRTSGRPDSHPVLRVSSPDSAESENPAKRSGKYARPICVGIVTSDDICRPFISRLLLAHGYRTTRRTPSADSNELIDVVLILDRSMEIPQCATLQKALGSPVLTVSGAGSVDACGTLEFPCRFSDLERQVFAALGRVPPTRPEIDDQIGVSPGNLMSILSSLHGRLFQVFLDYKGLPVPDQILLDEGFQATVGDDTRDKGVRRLRQVLRYIRLDLQRIGTSGWRLVW